MAYQLYPLTGTCCVNLVNSGALKQQLYTVRAAPNGMIIRAGFRITPVLRKGPYLPMRGDCNY